MEQIMNNGSTTEENFELKSKMESTKQKCHICDSHFENLDIHFLTSHEPIEKSNFKIGRNESEDIFDVIDHKKEPHENIADHENQDIEKDQELNSIKSCDLRIDPLGQ